MKKVFPKIICLLCLMTMIIRIASQTASTPESWAKVLKQIKEKYLIVKAMNYVNNSKNLASTRKKLKTLKSNWIAVLSCSLIRAINNNKKTDLVFISDLFFYVLPQMILIFAAIVISNFENYSSGCPIRCRSSIKITK